MQTPRFPTNWRLRSVTSFRARAGFSNRAGGGTEWTAKNECSPVQLGDQGQDRTGQDRGGYFQWLAAALELCESRGGRPGLSVLTSLLVSVDVKLY